MFKARAVHVQNRLSVLVKRSKISEKKKLFEQAKSLKFREAISYYNRLIVAVPVYITKTCDPVYLYIHEPN